ncbi:MAG: hypothetical protein PVH61_13035 [Candidatus Aminicenantes bacterium]
MYESLLKEKSWNENKVSEWSRTDYADLHKFFRFKDVGFVAAHSIAELYAVLSILPVQRK